MPTAAWSSRWPKVSNRSSRATIAAAVDATTVDAVVAETIAVAVVAMTAVVAEAMAAVAARQRTTHRQLPHALPAPTPKAPATPVLSAAEPENFEVLYDAPAAEAEAPAEAPVEE